MGKDKEHVEIMNRAEKKELKWIMKNELQTRRFKRRPDWKGYEVYVPEYKGSPKIGPPLCVLVKDGEVRLTRPEESLEYLDYELEFRKQKIKELVDELYPAIGVEEGIDWKGYEVYEPIYKKRLYIGYPYVILVKGETARICTEEESLEYLNYKNKKQGR